jgi:hypothetical protein
MHLNSINLVLSPNLKILVPKEGLKLRLKAMHPTISIVMSINLDPLSSFDIIFMQHLKCSEKFKKIKNCETVHLPYNVQRSHVPTMITPHLGCS